MDNIRGKKYFSIKTKITLGIFLFAFITLGLVFSLSFFNTQKMMMKDLDLRLRNMVSIASLLVNPEEHSLIKVPADMDSDAYKNINEVLKNIKNNSTDIESIYTFRENEEGQIIFVVDAEPDSYSNPGTVYDDANQFLLDNFLKIDSPIAEKTITSDKWGSWISGYAPFYGKDGHREGVLGIDIKASDIVEKQRGIFITYLISFIFSVILSILLGLLLSNRLVKSISFLTSILKNDANSGNFIMSNDEVGEFTSTLKTTLDQINSNQKNTEEKISDKTKMLEKMNKLMIGRELEMVKLKKEISELKKKLGEN